MQSSATIPSNSNATGESQAAANMDTSACSCIIEIVDQPQSQQLVSSEAALEDAHHLLAGLELHHHIGPFGLVQQVHEGLWGRGIHCG